MVKCGVFFAVRAELLNIIYTNFGFRGLIRYNSGYEEFEIFMAVSV
jgi:hypothetical protein